MTVAEAPTQYQFMPPMTPDERKRLKDSMRKHGMLPGMEPVVDEHGTTLDGHHRAEVARELGIPYTPRVVDSLDENGKWDYVFAANVSRRHLSQVQRAGLIEEYIVRHPEESNRSIARLTNSSDKTVAAARARVEETAEIPHFSSKGGRGITTGEPTERREALQADPTMAADHLPSCVVHVNVTGLAPSGKMRLREGRLMPREQVPTDWHSGAFRIPLAYPANHVEAGKWANEIAFYLLRLASGSDNPVPTMRTQ